MSGEHVESLRAAHAAFNRGDFDAAVALPRPDAEFVRPGLEAPLRGAAAIRKWMEPDAFDEQWIAMRLTSRPAATRC
jgi:ketosteroid isomerase-like protein